jgi:hypothetical protein
LTCQTLAQVFQCIFFVYDKETFMQCKQPPMIWKGLYNALATTYRHKM